MNAPLSSRYGMHQPTRSIGGILIDAGRLLAADADKVLQYQRETGLRFGEAGMALRLVSENDIQFALASQFNQELVIPGSSKLSPELVAAYTPQRPSVESLRALSGQLMLRWFGATPPRRCLAVVGSERRSGRSRLIANLAIVFSRLGERTLLIDADLRNPRQHQLFGLNNSHGLSGILSGRSGYQAIQAIPGLSALKVLPAGIAAPNPHELLVRPGFAQLLDDVAPDHDVILLDTPAAVGCADAHTVAASAGGALIVCKRHLSIIKSVQGLASSLQQCGVQVVGSVLSEK